MGHEGILYKEIGCEVFLKANRKAELNLGRRTKTNKAAQACATEKDSK
jgi:hypothetical protein